jgi:hypothetical protein
LPACRLEAGVPTTPGPIGMVEAASVPVSSVAGTEEIGMRSGLAGLDHVIIGVRDLERARLGWTRLGFTLTPRGRHLGQGTANYCIMFGRDYLELHGVVQPDEHADRLANFLARREGAMAVAFAPGGRSRKSLPRLPRSGCTPASRGLSAASSNCRKAPWCRASRC